jgi:ATP-dependent DNA helicase RecG
VNARIDLRELAARESEQVEWKENVADEEDVVATIVAFANDLSNLGGGYVVCGAQESKDEHGFQTVTMVGLTSSRLKTVEGKVLALCRDVVEPVLVPAVEELETPDPSRRVLVFVVPASRRAHTLRLRSGQTAYYVRVGRNTIEARNGLYRELLLRKGEVESWDRRMAANASVDEIDLFALRDALQRMGVFDPARGVDDYLSDTKQLSPFVPPLCVRESLTGAVRPRNFTLLLFGREPQKHIAGSFVLFSIYPGVDRSEPHAERHEIAGPLLVQISRLIELLNVQSYTVFDKTDESTPNALKYPRRALHEAMVNALVHRDYESVDPTRITVFTDRIEIVSPGGLATGVQLDELRAGRATAKWRSQSLAWFLNRLQLAQAEGQGIPTILRTMHDEGCPPPIFDIVGDRLICTLPAHPRHALKRELQAIERAVSLGELDRARERIRSLADKDPFDFRVVQLFAEIHRALADSRALIEFVSVHDSHLDHFPGIALVHLGDALLSMADPTTQQRDVAQKLFKLASRGRFEEREARKVALGLLKVRDPAAALQFLEECLRDHPEWRARAPLLQLRGRAYLGLAWKCRQTAYDRGLPPQTRKRAWQDCEDYMERAKRDIEEALLHGPEPAVADHARHDLEDLTRLRAKLRQPRRPR